MLTLRNYQQECVDAIWSNMDRHCVACLPTGAGKTPTLAELIRRCLEFPDTHILLLTHKRELIRQNAATLERHLPEHIEVGIFCAGLRRKELRQVTIASVQSLVNAEDLPNFEIIIVDEVHLVPHGTAGQYHELFKRMPNARIIGLTATPYRTGMGMIHEGDDALFDCLVYEAETSKLIEQGWLSPIISKASKQQADLSGVHTRGGEFIEGEMAAAMDIERITLGAVKDVLTHAKDRSSILVFAASVEHAYHVEQSFRKAGIASIKTVTQKTSMRERDMATEEFRTKQLRILINVRVFTTGFDAPNVDCIVMLLATESPGLYVQILGRGLRKAQGKDNCLLLDYGGNIQRFGPLDEITSKRACSGDRPPPQKTCPTCDLVVKIQVMECHECGHRWERDKRDTVPHGVEASDLDPIKATVIKEIPVNDVIYRRHQKTGKPDSMRVEYRIGMWETVKEYVCIEHGGFASSKAKEWLSRRGAFPIPRTVEDALKISPSLVKPTAIIVRRGKYDEIIGYKWTKSNSSKNESSLLFAN